jgi:hypothetical protein
MRHTLIIAWAALFAAILAIWGATTILANPQRAAGANPPAPSVDVMQLMKNAKDLPDRPFGAN